MLVEIGPLGNMNNVGFLPLGNFQSSREDGFIPKTLIKGKLVTLNVKWR